MPILWMLNQNCLSHQEIFNQCQLRLMSGIVMDDIRVSMHVKEEKNYSRCLSLSDKYAIDKKGTLVSSGGTAGYCLVSTPADCQYSIYYIQAILGSVQGEWLASLYGEIFRGGYIARGTKVLKQIRIPTIDFSNIEEKKDMMML